MQSTHGLPAHFMTRVAIENTGCWRWTGSIASNGYGRFAVGQQRSLPAHRVAYEAANGPVPPGLELAQPNLVPSSLKQGRRQCLTCSRADAARRRAAAAERRAVA